MKSFLQILAIFLSAQTFASTWQDHWHQGHEFFSSEQFDEASIEFDQAINLMTEEDQDKFPYVLVDRAENDFYLTNYTKVIQDTDRALKSPKLTDQERLNCGMRRISVFMILGDEEAAVEEYKKYIIGCPLFPKYDFSDEKIVIRNVPDCKYYKDSTKDLMLSLFCENEKDICEYDSLWIINVTKKCNSCQRKDMTNTQSNELPKQNIKISQRTESQIEACCNTVNRLAVSANMICGCLKTGGAVGLACKMTCAVFVEAIRETAEWCCYNSGTEENCWEKFKTWKVKFKKKNEDCPNPPVNCNQKK